MLKDKLDSYKTLLNSNEQVLLDCFNYIDETLIDQSKEFIEQKKDFIAFHFYRKFDKSYPIHLELGIKDAKTNLFSGLNMIMVPSLFYKFGRKETNAV